MAKDYNLGDLRAAIGDANRQIQEEHRDGMAPNELVLTRLKQERTSLIEAFTPQLVDIALTKLLNDVARRNHKGGPLFFQEDLFAHYPNLPTLFTIRTGLKKAPGSLTLREAQLIIDRRKKRASRKDSDDLERIVDECMSLRQSDDDTLDLLASRKAKSEDSSREDKLARELQPH